MVWPLFVAPQLYLRPSRALLQRTPHRDWVDSLLLHLGLRQSQADQALLSQRDVAFLCRGQLLEWEEWASAEVVHLQELSHPTSLHRLDSRLPMASHLRAVASQADKLFRTLVRNMDDVTGRQPRYDARSEL